MTIEGKRVTGVIVDFGCDDMTVACSVLQLENEFLFGEPSVVEPRGLFAQDFEVALRNVVEIFVRDNAHVVELVNKRKGPPKRSGGKWQSKADRWS